MQVVGVAKDVTEDLVVNKKHPAIYFPLRAADYAQPSLRGVTLMLRAVPGVDAIGAVRREISAMDSAITPFNARSMTEQIAQFMSALKAASWTYGLIGVFGLILASVGLAGVTAYSVAQRGHEIGIRLALGRAEARRAGAGDEGRRGAGDGGRDHRMAVAWAGMRALAGMFFSVASVQGADPVLLVGAPLLLAGWRWPPATCRRGSRRASTRWWRCGRSKLSPALAGRKATPNTAKASFSSIRS